MNKQGKIYTIIFTFIVSFVFVFVLAFANDITKEQVEINEKLFEVRAFLNALGIGYDSGEDAIEIFEGLKVENINDTTLYSTSIENEKVYAYRFTGNALWGTVNGVLAVNEQVDRIIGMDIISHNETPSLGGRIEEKWFRDQFRNEKISEDGISINVGGDGDYNSENSEFDSITGATNTSQSMKTIINNTINKLKNLLGSDD
jgi:Na+-transporting NADH:ubiquinone oxidoreductase subunit C